MAIPSLVLGLDPVALLLPWPVLHLLLPVCFPDDISTADGPRSASMLRFLLDTVFCCCLAGFAGSYAAWCGLNGSPVFLAALLPWLCRCVWACFTQTGRRTLRSILIAEGAAALVYLAFLMVFGIRPLGLGFGLSLGAFAAAFAHLWDR